MRPELQSFLQVYAPGMPDRTEKEFLARVKAAAERASRHDARDAATSPREDVSGGTIRAARTASRLSQAALGALVKMSRPTICAIEAGRRQVRAIELPLFVKALGYDEQALITGDLAGYEARQVGIHDAWKAADP